MKWTEEGERWVGKGHVVWSSENSSIDFYDTRGNNYISGIVAHIHTHPLFASFFGKSLNGISNIFFSFETAAEVAVEASLESVKMFSSFYLVIFVEWKSRICCFQTEI